MNHNIKGLTRTLAVIAGATLLLAACGGGSSSSGRTRNAALCYADQAEKDAAVPTSSPCSASQGMELAVDCTPPTGKFDLRYAAPLGLLLFKAGRTRGCQAAAG